MKPYSSWEALKDAISDGQWTLFLDRDGTINKRLPGKYIDDKKDFEFLHDAIPSLYYIQRLFKYQLIVTNQQGIAKEIMSHQQLADVHSYMVSQLEEGGVYLDQIYYSPDLANSDSSTRKPAPGMALQAAQDFDGIEFKKSIMVGDSPSDMKFGRQLGMITIWIQNKELLPETMDIDFEVTSLAELALYLQ